MIIKCLIVCNTVNDVTNDVNEIGADGWRVESLHVGLSRSKFMYELFDTLQDFSEIFWLLLQITESAQGYSISEFLQTSSLSDNESKVRGFLNERKLKIHCTLFLTRHFNSVHLLKTKSRTKIRDLRYTSTWEFQVNHKLMSDTRKRIGIPSMNQKSRGAYASIFSLENTRARAPRKNALAEVYFNGSCLRERCIRSVSVGQR